MPNETMHTRMMTLNGHDGAKEDKTDDEDDKIGPGTYDVNDTLTHPRTPSVFFGEPPAVDEIDGSKARREGDILVLHPETVIAGPQSMRAWVLGRCKAQSRVVKLRLPNSAALYETHVSVQVCLCTHIQEVL